MTDSNTTLFLLSHRCTQVPHLLGVQYHDNNETYRYHVYEVGENSLYGPWIINYYNKKIQKIEIEDVNNYKSAINWCANHWMENHNLKF